VYFVHEAALQKKRELASKVPAIIGFGDHAHSKGLSSDLESRKNSGGQIQGAK